MRLGSCLALLLVLLVAAVLPVWPVYAAGMDSGDLAEPGTLWIFSTVMGFLMPVGVMLVFWGGSGWDQMPGMASAGMQGLFLAMVGYFATGFGLQYGGIGWGHDLPGLEGLAAPFVSTNQVTAGFFGTRGFFLLGEAAGPGPLFLFLSHLPWVMTAVLLPTMGLQRHAPGWVRAIAGLLIGGLVYPLVANWAWAGGPAVITAQAGGWLGNLGFNAGLGHGFVDFGEASIMHLTGGSFVLIGLLLLGKRTPKADPDIVPAMPPIQLPMLAVLGMLLWGLGWLANLLSHPLWVGAAIPWATVMLGMLAGMLAGASLSQVYAWFTRARRMP